MKLKEIQNLIKFVAKSGASEVSLEMENVKITVKTSNDSPKAVVQEPIVIPPQPQITSTPHVSPTIDTPDAKSSDENSNYITIKSPIIGTAYLAPEPGGKKFVEIGNKIKKGDTVMIVEAMKTMNHVPSTKDGVVKKIVVEDGQPVEYGQTLVILE